MKKSIIRLIALCLALSMSVCVLGSCGIIGGTGSGNTDGGTNAGDNNNNQNNNSNNNTNDNNNNDTNEGTDTGNNDKNVNQNDNKKGGCKSFATGSVALLSIVSLAGAYVVQKKKKNI